MPAAGMSLGVDYNFGLYDANTGAVVNLGDIQQIMEHRRKHDIDSKPYNGQPKFANISDGYEGTFRCVRTGPAMQNLQIFLDAKLNSGAPMLPGYINETIFENNGTLSKYQYVSVDFALVDAGDVSREKNVTITIHWRAADKVRLL